MPMPRRTPSDLPVRLHEKHGGYYYVFQNVWDFLSRDRAEAIRLAEGLNNLSREQRWVAIGKVRTAAAEIRRMIFERDGGKCFYCGSETELGIDHVVPFEKGGSSLPFNLVLACRACNSAKGEGDPREFLLLLSGGRERLIDAVIRQFLNS